MKALIFDLDDTLYDQIEPFQRALAKHFNLADEVIEPLYVAFRHYSDEVFEATVRGDMTLEASYIYRLQQALAEFDMIISEEQALAIQQDYQVYQGQISLSPECVEILAFCRERGIVTGVITNGPHQHQLKKIEALNLLDWMGADHILISGQVGITKPSPEIFDLMVERLHLSKADTYYLGDSFATDVVGSRVAGLKSIWLNHRNRQLPDSPVRPDITVTERADLYETIVRLTQ